MARFSRAGLALLALVPSLAAAQTTAALPQPTTIEGAVSYVYKSAGGTELRLHVFSPANHRPATPAPAILFFFGGGWTSGTVVQFVPQARHLAERGMIAVVADYRVFSRHQTSPFEAMSDAKSAIRWIRSHAAKLGVNPNRIAAAGGSSGGHIALGAAVFDGFDEAGEDRKISSKPDALILFNPVVDTTRETPPQLKQRFSGRAREASPLHSVRAGLPPTVIFHGRADATVPYADAEKFCEQSKKLGNECQLFGYDGATHGFFNPARDEGRWHEETLRELDRFLTRLGYLRER